MRKKLLMPEWPLPRPAEMPPAPLGNDGPARFVAWVEAACGVCGHDCAWRDQYLRLHCARCEPAPAVAERQNLEARWERWGPGEALPAPGRPVQLRLFDEKNPPFKPDSNLG